MSLRTNLVVLGWACMPLRWDLWRGRTEKISPISNKKCKLCFGASFCHYKNAEYYGWNVGGSSQPTCGYRGSSDPSMNMGCYFLDYGPFLTWNGPWIWSICFFGSSHYTLLFCLACIYLFACYLLTYFCFFLKVAENNKKKVLPSPICGLILHFWYELINFRICALVSMFRFKSFVH